MTEMIKIIIIDVGFIAEYLVGCNKLLPNVIWVMFNK